MVFLLIRRNVCSICPHYFIHHIDGLVQFSSASATKLLRSCAKQSIREIKFFCLYMVSRIVISQRNLGNCISCWESTQFPFTTAMISLLTQHATIYAICTWLAKVHNILCLTLLLIYMMLLLKYWEQEIPPYGLIMYYVNSLFGRYIRYPFRNFFGNVYEEYRLYIWLYHLYT